MYPLLLGLAVSYNPIYMYRLMQEGAIGGMSFRIASGCTFILIYLIYRILRNLNRPFSFNIIKTPLFMPMNGLLLLYILAVLIGLINNNDKVLIALDTYPLFEMFIVYYAIKFTPNIFVQIDSDKVAKWVGIYFGIMCISGIVSYSYLTFVKSVRFGVILANVAGITVNRLMDFMVPIFLPIVIAYSVNNKKKILGAALIILGIAVSFLSFYRTVYLAVFAPLVYLMLKSKFIFLGITKKLIIYTLAMVVVMGVIEDRMQWKYDDTSIIQIMGLRIYSIFFKDVETDSGSIRVTDTVKVFAKISSCLVTGYGMGGILEYDDEDPSAIQVQSNYFLQTVLLMGLPGGALFIFIYIKTLITSFNRAKLSERNADKFIFTACTSILISLGVILSLFPYTNYFPLLYIFGFICGLVDTYTDRKVIHAINEYHVTGKVITHYG